MDWLFYVTWILSYILTIALSAIAIYQLSCLIDLEDDHANSYDTADRVNSFVRIEYYSLGLLLILHLVTGHWFTLLLCLPYVCYSVHLYIRRWHLVDVIEVCRELPREKKQRKVKLVWAACFCAYLVIWITYCSKMDMD